MTDYDLMNQAADWKEVLTQARKEKLLVLEEGKRVRDYVAAVLGEKPTKIAQLEAINNNATEEVKEQFEKHGIIDQLGDGHIFRTEPEAIDFAKKCIKKKVKKRHFWQH